MNLVIDPAVLAAACEGRSPEFLDLLQDLLDHRSWFRLHMDEGAEPSVLGEAYSAFIERHYDDKHPGAKIVLELLMDGPRPKGIPPGNLPWSIPPAFSLTRCSPFEKLLLRMASAMQPQAPTDSGLALLLPGPSDPQPSCAACRRRTGVSGEPGTKAAVTEAHCLHRDDLRACVERQIEGLEVRYASDGPTSGTWGELGLVARLAAVQPGPEDAGRYHCLMLEILPRVLPGLRDPKKEEVIHDGGKRLDIVFHNGASSGFFSELIVHHRVTCPYVLVECKNYHNDLGNREIDQLLGRLSETYSTFGFLVCRTVTNPLPLIRECREQYLRNRVYILVLTDNDIVALLKHAAIGDWAAITRHLGGLLHQLKR